MVRRYEYDDILDRRLREALEPRPGQAARMAREALRPREESSSRRRAAAALVAGAVVALVLGVSLGMPGLRPATPEEPASSSARYSLYNRNGVLVVRSLGGGTAFLQAGERSQDPAPAMIFIVRGRSAS